MQASPAGHRARARVRVRPFRVHAGSVLAARAMGSVLPPAHLAYFDLKGIVYAPIYMGISISKLRYFVPSKMYPRGPIEIITGRSHWS